MEQKITIAKDDSPGRAKTWLVRWYGEYDVCTGKQKRYCKGFKLRKDAELFADEKKAEFQVGMPRDQQDITLKQLCQKFMETRPFHLITEGASRRLSNGSKPTSPPQNPPVLKLNEHIPRSPRKIGPRKPGSLFPGYPTEIPPICIPVFPCESLAQEPLPSLAFLTHGNRHPLLPSNPSKLPSQYTRSTHTVHTEPNAPRRRIAAESLYWSS
jgi:hypothetical protein